MAITISSIGTNKYKLCASASDVLGTHTNNSEGATSITISCDSTNTAYARYLASPQTNYQATNSIVLEILWGTPNSQKARQEVVIMVPSQKITSVKWKIGNTSLSKTTSWTSVGSSNITVEVSISTDETSTHGTLSNLALYGYYVSTLGKGYLGGGQVSETNTKMGSWNSPGKARHRATSANGGWTNQYYAKDFSFTPPSDIPLYYIMIAYKGWKLGIGHIMILEGSANTLHCESSYWDGGYNAYIRYSFYGVYEDGTSPSISADYAESERARNNNTSYQNTVWRNKARKYAMWIQYNTPVALYDVTWYRWKGSASATNSNYILRDSNNYPLQLKVANNVAMRVPQVNYSQKNGDIVIFDATSEKFSGKWYQKTGSGNWGTTQLTNAQVEAIKMNGSSLSFAAIIEPKTYTITYKDKDTKATKTFTVNHGTTLTINPYGNLGGGTATHKYPHQSGSYTGTGSYTVTVTKDLEIEDPTSSLGWRFIGWIRDGNTLTAYWEPNTVTITYISGEGTGSNKIKTADYNKKYNILTYDHQDIDFHPPASKPYFVNWKCSNGKTYTNSIPAADMKTTSLTLTAQWGSPWKKVIAIWIYSDTQIAGRVGIKQGNGYWYPYKPWVHKT